MASCGPGGTVLSQAHTRRHARDGRRASIMNRDPYQTWRDSADATWRRSPHSAWRSRWKPTHRPTTSTRLVRRQLDAYCLG